MELGFEVEDVPQVASHLFNCIKQCRPQLMMMMRTALLPSCLLYVCMRQEALKRRLSAETLVMGQGCDEDLHFLACLLLQDSESCSVASADDTFEVRAKS